MAKFCGKCGAKLDETTGSCPECNSKKMSKRNVTVHEAEEQVVEKKLSRKEKKQKRRAEKKARKKEKKAKQTIGQKLCRFFGKLILLLLFLVLIIGALWYLKIINIPLLQEDDTYNKLNMVNQKCISVETRDIIMKNDMEGTATILVRLPDYEMLFAKASVSEVPEEYLLEALKEGKFEIQEYEMKADVTIEKGDTIIHSDEVVHQLLEKALIDAINSLSEEK